MFGGRSHPATTCLCGLSLTFTAARNDERSSVDFWVVEALMAGTIHMCQLRFLIRAFTWKKFPVASAPLKVFQPVSLPLSARRAKDRSIKPFVLRVCPSSRVPLGHCTRNWSLDTGSDNFF